MIKLNDAVLADIKANACNGGMSIEDAIRAFYDAQIDKQAKTMEELWNMEIPDISKQFNKFLPENEHDICEKDGKAIHKTTVAWFCGVLHGFLAAGGTIKE